MKLAPERLERPIRGGYVYRNDDEHFLTDKGRDALAQLRVQPGDGTSTEGDHEADFETDNEFGGCRLDARDLAHSKLHNRNC